MKKKKISKARFFKYFIAVFLLSVLVVITMNFFSRSKKRIKITPSQGELVKQKVENKENVIYFEDKKGKPSRKVKVDRYYIGEDGWYHLEGNVEISFLKSVDGQNVYFSGDEIIHNKEATQFRLTGNSIIKFKDLVIKSSVFEYEAKTDTVKSNKGVEFSSGEISGSARIVNFKVKKEALVLSKDVKLELSMDTKSDIPLFVSGKKLDYSHKRRGGLVEGDVVLDYGKSQIKADNMDFDFFRDKENINTIFLEGNVFLSLIAEEEHIELGDNDSLMSAAKKREIEAREVFIKNYKDAFQIKSMKAKGNCRFLNITASGSSSEILAESLVCTFKQDGILRRFDAIEKVRMTELKINKKDRRIIQGDYLIIEGEKNHLKVKGNDVSKAIIQSTDYRVSAGEIDIVFDNDNLFAKDGITVILYPVEGQRNSIGFFSKNQPVFIIAGEMMYIDKEQCFYFKENVKAWQGNDMLGARKLTLFKDTGRFQCEESVESSFSYIPKNKDTEEKIKISSDSMKFKPAESVLIYKTDCKLNVKNTELLAQSLSVSLHQESAELLNILAYSDVKIIQNTFEGRGKEARYNLGEEMIVLLGDPVLIDKDKGKTEGDKLTFSLGDGKILIENQDQKRSKTVIK
jgi:lipopolysaccharide export system protein LptA